MPKLREQAMGNPPKEATEPKKFEKFKAPAGGMISGNIFYPGGRMLPLEATGQEPKKMAESETEQRKNPLLDRSFIFVGMKSPVRESVKKFKASNDKDEASGPSTGVTGYGFSSPNTKPMGELQFPEASQAIGSDEQAHHVRQVENVLLGYKIPKSSYKVYNAVGDWGVNDGYGAENSAVHVIKHPMEWNTLRKAAAKIGLLKKQTSVLTFMPKEGGKSVLHRLYVPSEHSMDHIRETLRHAGIENRTVVPAPDGAHVVFVVEPEKYGGGKPETIGTMDRISKQLGGHKVDRTNGISSFVGQEGHDGKSDWTYQQHSRPEYKAILAGTDAETQRGLQMDSRA